MKPKLQFALLSLCIAPMLVQPPAVGGSVGSDVRIAQHFESGLGFSYEVPSDLTIINSKQFEKAAKSLAQQQGTTEAEAKSIHCVQQLLVAERRDESRIINFVAFPQDCAGGAVTEKNLANVGKYGSDQLAKRFTLISPEYSSFTVGTHAFWVMRSAMVPSPPQNPNHEIAFVVILTPQAVIECMLLARTRADLEALTATKLRFDDGAVTELIPASAFAAKQQ
jgi:hypothetical protein